jgi:hypothetical protein
LEKADRACSEKRAVSDKFNFVTVHIREQADGDGVFNIQERAEISAFRGIGTPGVVEPDFVEKEKIEKEEPLPPEVKVKLRRDGKDNYSWELSGSDADQILKVNEKLRKQLTGEQTR